MTSIFGAIDVARKGLAVTQRGLATAGHNIANANTPGFSRQRLVQAAEFPIRISGGLLGTGVRALTIERATDPFIQSQLVRQRSTAASSEAQANVLSQIEQILNEQDTDGLTAALGDFYDAADDLATSGNPGAASERAAYVSSAQSVVDLLHTDDARLRSLMSSTNDGIAGLLPQINTTLEQIDFLNEEIARLEIGELNPANDLRDQRDLALQDLAEMIDVRTYEDQNGNLNVTLANGVALVEGDRARTLIATADPTNPFDSSFARVSVQDQSSLTDVTTQIGGGRLGGLLRARDTILPAAIRSLDTVAYNLIESVNTVHAAGMGLNGAVGNFFTALPQVEDAARDLTIGANILANPDEVAAGLTTQPGDNQNALALAALRDQKGALFLPGDPPGPATGPSRSIIEHAVAVIVDVGQQAKMMDSAALQQDRIIEGLQNRRDEISGVSIDEEVAQLVRLQAAFQANSRVISVVQDLLDDLVNIL